ncbi:hypothetical protein ACVLVH_004639 [Kluyvera sp. 1366]
MNDNIIWIRDRLIPNFHSSWFPRGVKPEKKFMKFYAFSLIRYFNINAIINIEGHAFINKLSDISDKHRDYFLSLIGFIIYAEDENPGSLQSHDLIWCRRISRAIQHTITIDKREEGISNKTHALRFVSVNSEMMWLIIRYFFVKDEVVSSEKAFSQKNMNALKSINSSIVIQSALWKTIHKEIEIVVEKS